MVLFALSTMVSSDFVVNKVCNGLLPTLSHHSGLSSHKNSSKHLSHRSFNKYSVKASEN